jgi:site-specific DNA-methyltransferase (adenine-specific)
MLGLKQLADRINRNHEAGEAASKKSLRYYEKCGHDLLWAKVVCRWEKIRWQAWLRDNVKFNRMTAWRYMALAKCNVTLQMTPDQLWEEWQKISGNRSRSQQETEQLLLVDGLDSDARILHAARRITTKRREQRLRDRERQKQAQLKRNHPLQGRQFKLLHGDFVEVCRTFKAGSVDLIVTDPPYERKYLPLYGLLSQVASRVLKPGGSCLVATGTYHLPEVLNLLSQNLTYQWVLCHGVLSSPVFINERSVVPRWNPYIWLTKGENTWKYVSDVIDPHKMDKRFHDWGKAVGVMAALIERFSVKGDTVLDPFLGGGSTAVAAMNLKRLFIGIDKDRYAVNVTAERLAKGEVLPESYSSGRAS